MDFGVKDGLLSEVSLGSLFSGWVEGFVVVSFDWLEVSSSDEVEGFGVGGGSEASLGCSLSEGVEDSDVSFVDSEVASFGVEDG